MYLGHTAEHYVVSQLPLNETGSIKFHTCILHLADLAESSQEPSQRQSWVDACHRGTFWQTLTCACWGRVWSAIATMQRGQATLQKSKNQLHVGEASAELGDFELKDWATGTWLEHLKYLGLEGALKSHGIPRLIILVRGRFSRHLNWIRGCRVPDLQAALDQKGSYCHPGCCWGLLKKNHQLSWKILLNLPLLFGTQLQHPLDLRSSKMIRNGQLPPGNGGGVQRLLEVAEFHVPEVTCNNFNFNCLPPLGKKNSWILSQAHRHVSLGSLRSRSRSLHCLKAREPAQHTIYWSIVVSSESKFLAINLDVTKIPSRNYIYMSCQITSEKYKNAWKYILNPFSNAMQDMHQLQAKALRTLWTWSANTSIHPPRHPLQWVSEYATMSKLQKQRCIFSNVKISSFEQSPFENGSVVQTCSNWATEWTDRTKAQKISRLSLAVAGDWDAEPHPRNNKCLLQTQKLGKSQKVSSVLSANVC